MYACGWIQEHDDVMQEQALAGANACLLAVLAYLRFKVSDP